MIGFEAPILTLRKLGVTEKWFKIKGQTLRINIQIINEQEKKG